MDRQYSDELRDQLVDAASRRQDKAQRRARVASRVAVGMIVVVLAVGVMTVVEKPKSEAAVLKVETRGALIDVSIADLTASPTQVRDELRNAGVSATVNAVPVAAPMVGSFVALETGPAVKPLQTNQDAFRRFTIDTSVSRDIELSIGREATPGEPYARPFDAYAVGGPLHCAGAWGQTVSSAAPIVAEHFNGNVDWKYVSPTSGPVSTTPSESAQKYVVDAQLISSDEMLVFVTDTPASPFVGSSSTGPQQCAG